MGKAVDLYVMGAAMRSLPGRIVRHEGEQLWVVLNQGLLESGEAVCLQTSNSAPWLYGKVVGNEEEGVVIHIDGSHTPDRREFSRVWGPLHLRFQVVGEEGFELAERRWLRNAQGIGPKWQHPPMFMDFSGSGARFDVRGRMECQPDDRLLVGVRVPGDGPEHRLTARVVRFLENNTQLAIHFIESTDGAIATVVGFAERIQEQMVELLGDGGDDVFDDLDSLDDLDTLDER